MFALIEEMQDIQKSVLHTEVDGANKKEEQKHGKQGNIIGSW